MNYAGTFPFGWLRGLNDSNWQILWNKNTGDLFIKSAQLNEIQVLENFKNWKDAKIFADKLGSNPDLILK